MPCQQIIIELGELDTQQVEDTLLELGALSITLNDAAENTADEQPVLEPGPGETPLWPDITLTALFSAATDTARVMHNLCAALALATPPAHRVEPVHDQDWSRAWLKDFKPLQFGQRLWIVPSAWEPPVPDATNILLDPGLAFGTGTHPTTALCLEWLEQQNLTDKTVLDFGCGSGVLAIAALKLGAMKATGIDNDAQALTASRDNASHNQVIDQLTLALPNAMPGLMPNSEPKNKFSIIVANILANPLIERASHLAKLTEKNGYIALSGILTEQQELINQAYAPFFTLVPAREKSGWLLISGQRKS